jgi:hypothetical protein
MPEERTEIAHTGCVGDWDDGEADVIGALKNTRETIQMKEAYEDLIQ